MRSAVLLALSLLLVACRAPEPHVNLVKLPSGKMLKVISVTKVQFAKGGPALMLKYQTDVPITDVPALEREAREIWPNFMIDVERAKLNNAILSATSLPTGTFAARSAGYNFVLQKGANGLWQRLPPPK